MGEEKHQYSFVQQNSSNTDTLEILKQLAKQHSRCTRKDWLKLEFYCHPPLQGRKTLRLSRKMSYQREMKPHSVKSKL